MTGCYYCEEKHNNADNATNRQEMQDRQIIN